MKKFRNFHIWSNKHGLHIYGLMRIIALVYELIPIMIFGVMLYGCWFLVKYLIFQLLSMSSFSFPMQVACFPFDDHNCPPLQLIALFCKSAYSWLKEDIENVVVVHCKAGMGRTGIMISSLLLFLKVRL